MKTFAFIIITNLVCCNLYAQTTDSIRTHQLNEVIVHAERGWIEDGVVNFIPSKSEKRLSNSPATLIKSMHLPFIKEKDGAVVSTSGEVIPIFINGEKADKIDLATFWPKQVRRVQYIENPSDPRYEGVKKAVNFIMPVYEVGGVSRINLFQKMPNNGYYTAASKLVHKKMTYGFLFSGNYYRDHRSDMTGEEQYKDIYYNGEKYDCINRTEDSHSYSRDEGASCAFNAKYATDKTRITHTVSLGWRRNPGSGSHSQNMWSENLFDTSNASSYFTSKNLSPQISGNYYFALSNKWYLSGVWKYAYAQNKNFSSNQMGSSPMIYNSNYEDVNSCKLAVMPSFIPSEKWTFQLRAMCNLDWYATHYNGSVVTQQNQSRQEISSALKIFWTPTRTVNLSLEPELSASLWQIGDIHQHTINPIVRAALHWNPYRKFSLNGTLLYYMRPTSASESNPVLVKSSELLWFLGNPYLKNLTSWDTYISATYLPKNWLAVSFRLGYVKTLNNVISTYDPAPLESGGLIKKFINAEPSDNIRANIDFSSSFFDDNLSISLTPQWYYTYVRGAYQDKFNYLTFSGSADYTLGDFRIGLWYEGPYKDLSVSGMEKSWKQDNWNASLTYGHKNLYLEFRIEDILNNKRKSWVQYSSPNFVSKYDYLETGRTFSINLTYTFGYGKKLDKRIDIKGPESAKTSILQSK